MGHNRQEPNVITTISFCPASKVLISGDNFGECKIWNVDEFYKPVCLLTPPISPSFSPLDLLVFIFFI